MKNTVRRILEISHRHKLSHIGSCLSALPVIEEIYSIKKPDERFILSAGHSHLAHAVVMEERGLINDAEENIINHGIHCERSGGCDCSTGSLGQGLPIALGMAMANRKKNVYCLISDGECSEGSVWEAICIRIKYRVFNLRIFCNFNGFGAYDPVSIGQVMQLQGIIVRFTGFGFDFLKDQDAHYHIITDDEYKSEVIGIK